ncbi:unnamed protein product, partial [Amoebophrya sp. A120]
AARTPGSIGPRHTPRSPGAVTAGGAPPTPRVFGVRSCLHLFCLSGPTPLAPRGERRTRPNQQSGRREWLAAVAGEDA